MKSNPTEPTMPVWSRMPGESAKAYKAATMYFELRANRSLATVAKNLPNNVSQNGRWSKRWNWVSRAAAFDDYLAKEQRIVFEKEALAEDAKWRRRDAECAEQEFQFGEKCVNKADKMLDFPLTKITRDGGKTTIKAAKWTLKDAPTMAKAGFKMKSDAIQPNVIEDGDLISEEFVVEDYDK